MPNLFAKLNEWLPRKSLESAGTTLTLTRGSEATESVPAVVGQVSFQSNDETGVRVEVGDLDLFIRAAEYLIAGVAVLPALGDQYQESGSNDVYELQTPSNGERAWRWSDPERTTTYRLHVKRVRTNP